MVAEAIDIDRETYFCILMDRESNGPVLVASPDGGVDIEEVAEKTPDRIKKIPVDIFTGVTDENATEIAKFLGFDGELRKQCAEQARLIFFIVVLYLMIKMTTIIDCRLVQLTYLSSF